MKGKHKGLETLRKLVQAVCLRRTKEIIADELNLLTFHKPICEVYFTDEERRLYDILKMNFAVILNNESATTASSMFQTIMRLRQFSNHGLSLLPRKVQEFLKDPYCNGFNPQVFNVAKDTCAGCGNLGQQFTEEAEMACLLDCGHILCKECRENHGNIRNNHRGICVSCNKDTERDIRESIYRPKVLYQPSSKVLALLKNIKEDNEGSTEYPVKR